LLSINDGPMRALMGLFLLLTPIVARAEPSGAPRPKIGALILKSSGADDELADNLSEVLIAHLARRGDHEIAGKEELKTKLGVNDEAAANCMENLDCLGRVGTELGVMRMVVGALGRRGSDYLYNLSLIDISTGRVESRVFELIAGGKVEALIGAVQASADKLFQPKVEPGALRVVCETRGALVYLDEAFIGSAPVRRDGIEPGAHHVRVEKEGHTGWGKDVDVPAGSTLEIKVPLAALPERRRWPGQLAGAMAAGTALSAVVGAVMVALAKDAPAVSSVTRAGALESSNRRFTEGLAGIGLFAAAGGLAVTAGVLALLYRRDIFHSSERRVSSVDLSPAGALRVRW
jgi:hypothetical protein